MGACMGKWSPPCGNQEPTNSPADASINEIITMSQQNRLGEDIIYLIYLLGLKDRDEIPSIVTNICQFAEDDRGWLYIVQKMVQTVPIEEPMGPLAMDYILDGCPLQTTETVAELHKIYNFSSARALTWDKSAVNEARERNLMIILNYLADKYAGPVSARLLTSQMMDYLFAFITDNRNPELVCYSMITIEKFAGSSDIRASIVKYLAEFTASNPLLQLEHHSDSENPKWRQVGFMARWLLDNILLVEGRPLSYTTVNMTGINAILDYKETTNYLKVGPNGLDARSDVSGFESVRGTCQVDKNSWYYEAKILTPGEIQIGWISKNTNFDNRSGSPIGRSNNCFAYDGSRCLLWHQAVATRCTGVRPWAPGDILGCFIDLNRHVAFLTLNGANINTSEYHLRIKGNHHQCECDSRIKSLSRRVVFPLGVTFTTIPISAAKQHCYVLVGRKGVYAAASLDCFQSVSFNFGASEFVYPPVDRAFNTFNGKGTISEDQKQIIPRWLYLQRQLDSKDEEVEDVENICSICYSNMADTHISCEHRGFCRVCAFHFEVCPLCRSHVWHYTILKLRDGAMARPTASSLHQMENSIVMDYDHYTVLTVWGVLMLSLFITCPPNLEHIPSGMALIKFSVFPESPHDKLARYLLQRVCQTIDNFEGGNILEHLQTHYTVAETYNYNSMLYPVGTYAGFEHHQPSTSSVIPNNGGGRADSGDGGVRRLDSQDYNEDDSEVIAKDGNRAGVDSQLEQESSMERQDCAGELLTLEAPVRLIGTPVYYPIQSEVSFFAKAHEYKPTPIISKGKRPPHKLTPGRDMVTRSKSSHEREKPDLSDESLLPRSKSDPLIGSTAVTQNIYEHSQSTSSIDSTIGPHPRLCESLGTAVEWEGAEAARLRHYAAQPRSPREISTNGALYLCSEPPPLRYCEPINVPKRHLHHLIHIYKQDRVVDLCLYNTMQGPSGLCKGSYGPIEELCYEQSGPASGRVASDFERPSTSRAEAEELDEGDSDIN